MPSDGIAMAISPRAEKMLKEAHGHYAQGFDEWFTHMTQEVNDRPIIGQTSDETLSRAYKRQGALDILEEMRLYIQSL